MQFTDTHSHIYDPQFSEDLLQVIDRARDCGVNNIIIPATSSDDYPKMEQLSSQFDFIHLAYGLHPTEIDSSRNVANEIELLKSKIANFQIVAIGETGLDKYWSVEFLDQQKESLHTHIQLSIKHNLPLILHCRDAFSDMFEILEQYKGKTRGVFHGFSGGIDEVEQIKELGDFYFGIGGVVTFKNSKLIEVVKQIPLGRIVLETDAPYLAPTPNRGRRNEPSYIPIIAKYIASELGITLEYLSQNCEEATQRLFNISQK